jgi:hypothetical protein
MKKNEKEILYKALRQLEELTGFITEAKLETKIPGKKNVDAKIRIPKLKETLYAEVKLNVTNQTIGAVAHQIKEAAAGKQAILIAGYITPQLAEKLKELDVQFLDTAGNAYINLPNLFLFVKGNKAKVGFIKEKPVRAFQPAGLQLIYALICNPGLEDKPYRLMAEKAGIANGAVTPVMRDLKKLGYILDFGKKGRTLTRKNELLQRWINLYAELLKPKLIIGRYNTNNTDWWKQEKLLTRDALLGGETGAAILTGYLKPQKHTIYTAENYGRLLLQLRLKAADDGNVELFKRFWNFDDLFDKDNLVNPVLIYADLIATGDKRNLETAKIIYDKKVIRYIGED